jgi:glucose dehydrogenase
MYVSLPGSHVVALDARTGAELWRYTHRKRTERCAAARRTGVWLSTTAACSSPPSTRD